MLTPHILIVEIMSSHQNIDMAQDLHWACTRGDLRTVSKLLSQGASVDWFNNKDMGKTPLHKAAETGRWDICNMLVKKNANVLAEDKAGNNCIQTANAGGHSDVAARLAALVEQGDQTHRKRSAQSPRRQKAVSSTLSSEPAVTSDPNQAGEHHGGSLDNQIPLSQKVVMGIQARLQAALYGHGIEAQQSLNRFDPDNTGFVTVDNFIKCIKPLCAESLNVSEIGRLTAMLDPEDSGDINYVRFCDSLTSPAELEREKVRVEEAKVAAEREQERRRQESLFRAHKEALDRNKPISDSALLEKLQTLVHQKIAYLTSLFRRFDLNHDGFVSYDEFHQGVEELCPGAFASVDIDRIARLIDESNDGFIDYGEFSQKMGSKSFVSNASNIKGNVITGGDTLDKEDESKKKMAVGYAPNVGKTPRKDQRFHELKRLINERVLSKGQFQRTFLRMDLDHDGIVTSAELQLGLQDLGLSLSVEDIVILMERMDLSGDGHLDYHEFARVMGEVDEQAALQTFDARSISPTYRSFGVGAQGPRQDVPASAEPRTKSRQQRVDDALKAKITEKLFSTQHSVRDVFILFDFDRDNRISMDEVRRGLDSLHFDLSDDQFARLVHHLNPGPDGTVDYEQFAKGLKFDDWSDKVHFDDLSHDHKRESHEKKLEEAGVIKRAASPGRPISAAERKDRLLRAQIMRQIGGNVPRLLSNFQTMDRNHTGRVSEAAFRKVLHNMRIELTLPEIERLLSEVTVDGQVDYHDFARLMSTFAVADEEPKGDSNRNRRAITTPWNQNASAEGVSTSSELKVLKVLRRICSLALDAQHRLNKELRDVDIARSGLVSTADYYRCLRKAGVFMSEADYELLCNRLDPHGTNSLNYAEVLEAMREIVGSQNPGSQTARSSADSRSGKMQMSRPTSQLQLW